MLGAEHRRMSHLRFQHVVLLNVLVPTQIQFWGLKLRTEIVKGIYQKLKYGESLGGICRLSRLCRHEMTFERNQTMDQSRCRPRPSIPVDRTRFKASYSLRMEFNAYLQSLKSVETFSSIESLQPRMKTAQSCSAPPFSSVLSSLSFS